MTLVRYTQITRTQPWKRFRVLRFDNWAFGVRVWRRGCSVRLFARTVMFESRDPWDHTEDIAAESWGVGCKRSWRKRATA